MFVRLVLVRSSYNLESKKYIKFYTRYRLFGLFISLYLQDAITKIIYIYYRVE